MTKERPESSAEGVLIGLLIAAVVAVVLYIFVAHESNEVELHDPAIVKIEEDIVETPSLDTQKQPVGVIDVEEVEESQ